MTDIFDHYDCLIGGGGPNSAAAGPATDPVQTLPLRPLGREGGNFYFLDITGELRKLSATKLAYRSELISLFLGDSTWLETYFPRFGQKRDSAGKMIEVLVGFNVSAAADFLMRQCCEAGLFGSHIEFRKPGVWADNDGRPVLHAGDSVWKNSVWRKAGFCEDDRSIIWPLAPSTPRPAKHPCDAAAVQELEIEMRHLWQFAAAGGPMLALGLVATAMLGGAARWRPNGFLIGEAGAGKSMLHDLLRALCPLHSYTNDTTKAGIEQALDGMAMPIFIDEAADRINQRGPQQLMEMVLASTSGDGARVLRGTTDGRGRAVQVVGAVIMASIAPPDMQPQHASRFTQIRLQKPPAGADNSVPMRDLIDQARALGPGLWARMLAGFEGWQRALATLRAALARGGCAPREQDQIGAQLAGWWVATHDTPPTDAEALDAVGLVGDFVNRADELVGESGPRRVLQHLLTRRVSLQRAGEQLPVHELMARVWGSELEQTNDDQAGGDFDWRHSAERARRDVIAHGIRVIAARERTPNGRLPQLPPGAEAGAEGVWLACQSAQLDLIFKDTPWAGQRWQYFLVDLPATRSAGAVRFAPGFMSRAFWISRDLIEGGVDDDGQEEPRLPPNPGDGVTT